MFVWFGELWWVVLHCSCGGFVVVLYRCGASAAVVFGKFGEDWVSVVSGRAGEDGGGRISVSVVVQDSILCCDGELSLLSPRELDSSLAAESSLLEEPLDPVVGLWRKLKV